ARRVYHNQYMRERYARNRAEWFDGKACVDCGATEELEADHVDPEMKVSSVIWQWPPDERAAELAKCVVRCGPCHRARHAAERSRHGIGGYMRGCRGDDCRAAKAEAKRRERAAARAGTRGYPPSEHLAIPDEA